MARTRLAAAVTLLLSITLGSGSLEAAASGNSSASAGTAADLRGTWSGAFQSDYSDEAPFTLTVKVDRDGQGRLIGKATHDSRCLRDLEFQVTINNSDVSLAGSDDQGNSMTFRGTLDTSGTVLTLRYIINGSAGGRCELDNGTGTLGKR
jgi:hypothetical protein